ncbi:SulP family inorganic anion transporter [Fulvivirgaceae bacterium BMA10]|uniref:SulP family inorganic anion transporter n=1 Tax=Splendidivirga corallicola TaxID=3051826 RepID=A0ABT8KVC2_9BACT|nr:SulP family inorganic anion transporter [Fulvivirgaceae bacterium BMA10]
MNKLLDFSHLRGDIFGGITAGIVALPLALAFGVQSGMGAIAGLYGAIALGFFAALLGGTATQISGPTGPMTVVSTMVISSAIEASGTIENGLGLIIASFFIAGALQVVMGVIRIGQYVKYIPYPVLSGFMSGIGVIIILFQIYPFLGHESEKSTIDIALNIANPLSQINFIALGLGALTIVIIYLFPRLTKVVPSALVALLIVTVLSVFFKLDIPRIGDIPEGLPKLYLGELFAFETSQIGLILQFGGTLALLGAIDSLLTSIVADNITKTQHNSNKELVGQGIGNMASAIIAGIPGAGATMRTVVNVNSGGRTRLSGIIHSVLLMIILLGAGKYAAEIPLSVLAGILITVGIGIIDYKGLRDLKHVPRTDAVILIVVLLLTVFWNLLYAVGIGMIMATISFMKKAADISSDASEIAPLEKFVNQFPHEYGTEIEARYKDKVYIKDLYGALFFGFASRFKEMVRELPEIEMVVIRMRRVPYLDQSGVYALEEALEGLQSKGIKVAITGLQEQPKGVLNKIKIVSEHTPGIMIFDTYSDFSKWLEENGEALFGIPAAHEA